MMRGFLGGILVLASLAAGCSSAPVRTDRGGESGNTVIRILSGMDSSINAGDDPLGGATGIYEQLVNWWNRNKLESTKIELRLDTVRGGATVEHSQMISEAQGGTDKIDIYNLDSQWVPEFVRGGYLYPLRDIVEQKKINKDDFLSKPWASTLDGDQGPFAVPFTTDVGLLYYRTDADPVTGKRLVTADQIKNLRTFGDVADLAEIAMRNARSPKVKEGYVGQFKNYEGLTVNALEAIWSYTPTTFTGRSPVEADKARRALRALVKAYKLLPPRAVTLADDGDFDETKAAADFAGGQAVMMRNWPIHYARLVAGGPGIVARKQFEVSALPYPSVLGGQNLAISRNTGNLDAAIKIVQFLTGRETQRCLFAVGGLPAVRHDAYDDKEVWPEAQPLPGPAEGTPERRCGKTKGRWTDIGSTIRTAVKRAQPRPPIPGYTRFSDVLSSGVYRMFSDRSGTLSDETITKLLSDLSESFDGPVAKP